MFLAIFVIKITIIITIATVIIIIGISSCPDIVCGQLNRGPCHSLTDCHSLSEPLFDFGTYFDIKERP